MLVCLMLVAREMKEENGYSASMVSDSFEGCIRTVSNFLKLSLPFLDKKHSQFWPLNNDLK